MEDGGGYLMRRWNRGKLLRRLKSTMGSNQEKTASSFELFGAKIRRITSSFALQYNTIQGNFYPRYQEHEMVRSRNNFWKDFKV